jgi:hypothetical protein
MFKAIRFFFNGDANPRIYLFCIAIVLKLAASALSGAAFVISSGPLYIAGTLVWIIWFGLLFWIARPQTDTKLALHQHHLKCTAVILLIILTTAGLGEVALTSGISQPDASSAQSGRLIDALTESLAYNDATALCHQAAQNFLDGENPYAAANIVSARISYNFPYDKSTPIRTGRFAGDFPYPDMDKLKTLWEEAVKTPEVIPQEIESRLNYPAGCFLLPAIFIRSGISDLRLIYLILIIPAMIYAIYRAPPDKRLWLLGIFLASLEVWNSIASGETGSLYFPFLLMAWLLIKRKYWLSAIFMGIAISIKQVPWFFLPFYLMLIFRTYGKKKTAGAISIAGAIFTAMNLPFIIPDPALWLNSVLAPMTTDFFPLGIGIITLVSSGYLTIQTPLIFTLASALAGIAGLVWYWFHGQRYPHAGLILAVLPLFCAWRSLWPYFFYFDLILIAAVIQDTNSPSPNQYSLTTTQGEI